MKFLDLTGLNTLWAKIKTLVSGKADKVSNATASNFAGLDANGNLKDSGKKESDFALRNVTYGEQGYVSYSAANPDILLEKLKLGSLSLYNHGTTIKIYEYDAGDEENATLVWDSSNLTGTALQNFENGKELGTIYTSPAGKCVKVTYNGAKYGGYNYIRAFGVFMTPKQVDSSHKATAIFRINGTNYKSYTIDTYGSLVTGICCNGNYTNAALLFTPNSDVVRMRFYGFRCLNTYAGTEGVLIGRSSSTLKLSDARKLAVNLANTSTDSTFDGSADQTGIKVSGKLPIANGGTNATTAADARTNLGAQATLPTTGTASATYAINISGSSASCTGNSATATKATQDSDGNAINATYFKANTSTTTLQSGTAVKVGTQNGADVKLQLPTIPAAANNGTLKIGLNGGTATSKFTADQSSDSTLTFASGTTAGTIKVDGTEVAVAGWSGKQDAMFVKFEFDSTLLYSDVTAAILNKAVPYLLDGNTMYVCDGNTWSVEVSNSTTTEYRFVAVTGNTSSPRISYRYIRANDSKGTGIISLATSSSVSSVAGSRFPYYEVDNPDWDDLTNTGEYAVTNSAAPNASPSKHSPEQGAVSARVYSIYSGSNLFITQIAVGDDMYYRAKFGSGNWSAWQYFIRSADVNRIVKGSLGSDPKTFYVV